MVIIRTVVMIGSYALVVRDDSKACVRRVRDCSRVRSHVLFIFELFIQEDFFMRPVYNNTLTAGACNRVHSHANTRVVSRLLVLLVDVDVAVIDIGFDSPAQQKRHTDAEWHDTSCRP